MAVTNTYVTIKNHIKAEPSESDFELRTGPLALGSGDTLVKVLCVSIDPYQLNRMKPCSGSHKSIVEASKLSPGQVIDGAGVGKVVASENPEFQEGDLVGGHMSWAEYTLVKARRTLKKLDTLGFPLSYHLGVLGASGLAAYAGFFKLCKPKQGEKVFVSAASGSVGSIVGQYAKLHGCHVVGCAGTPEKVALVKEKLGFDDAFNYKEEPDLHAALRRYFPDGIDIYFDNVGAEMLEAAVANMNHFGRVAACGVISEYTNTQKRAAPNMIDVIYKRIKIEGFLCTDHMDIYSDFVSMTSENLRSRKMLAVEDVSEGLKSLPEAFVGLFRGDNIGKKVVRIMH